MVRITCILAIHLDGSNAPPLIITKWRKDGIECVSGISVLESEKAWCIQAALSHQNNFKLPLVLQES